MRRHEVEQDTALAGLGIRTPGFRAGPDPPGHTRVPCEELADTADSKCFRAPAESAGRTLDNAVMERREAPHTLVGVRT
jgi:hypothetical protein